ncbi:D-erythronate dehydrogenase [Novosphingobium sp. Chol11]|uniref:D-erythronate dehydrogenase n=1 Tax=Novosphingobium sp. Chol11 TaxID=1385763 RepID=UPI000BE301A3|nr:D-erythronate dehydrogenase [Novosphingobium sp. Chol11]
MNIVITGGSGFLGQKLAHALLAQDGFTKGRSHLLLADRVAGPDLGDARVHYAVGDACDRTFVARLVAEADVIYHLAAVVSSEAEANFNLGMRVNIDAARLLLDECRAVGRCPRVIFTSSVAVFGPSDRTAPINDESAVDPRSSYGMEKAVVELLVAEYSRRGFIEGLTLRLPTISVRPGLPNRAASSFASSIIREPMSGQAAICPVPHDTALWLLSPRRAIAALVHAGALDTSSLGARRIVNLPGLSVTVGEILDALEIIGGQTARQMVSDVPDAAIEKIVASWPAAWDDATARALGFEGDTTIAQIIDAFVSDDLPSQRILRRELAGSD